MVSNLLSQEILFIKAPKTMNEIVQGRYSNILLEFDRLNPVDMLMKFIIDDRIVFRFYNSLPNKIRTKS